MIPVNSHPFPASTAKLIREDGTPTVEFYQFLLTLHNRGGGASGLINNATPGMVAGGAGQKDATQLIHDYSEVLTGSGGVRMTAVQPGQQHRVFNGTGGNINVYPPTNGQIDSLGNNQPYVLGSGKTQQFWASKVMTNGGTQYRSMILG